MKNNFAKNKGFTLVELIVAIAIMAILTSAVGLALIRFIDKARKADDIETAEVIFKAAQLASASARDEVSEGWTVAATTTNGNAVARTTVTNSGLNASKVRNYNGGTYEINCVAWARGLNYNAGGREWQNAQFKSTIDTGKQGDKQRLYTNEFLKILCHDDAVGGIYYPQGKNVFDGKTSETMEFKYKKDAGIGVPECWMVCVRTDNLKCEIWIGDKNLNGRGSGQRVRPLYRIYPEPCSNYRN